MLMIRKCLRPIRSESRPTTGMRGMAIAALIASVLAMAEAEN
jgi:hypothetical protein